MKENEYLCEVYNKTCEEKKQIYDLERAKNDTL